MAGTIGSLTVFARFNTEAFGKGIKKARSQTKGFSGFVKKNMGGYIEVQPRGFGRMLKNKRPTTKIYT